jgi:hypothetical protein
MVWAVLFLAPHIRELATSRRFVLNLRRFQSVRVFGRARFHRRRDRRVGVFHAEVRAVSTEVRTVCTCLGVGQRWVRGRSYVDLCDTTNAQLAVALSSATEQQLEEGSRHVRIACEEQPSRTTRDQHFQLRTRGPRSFDARTGLDRTGRFAGATRAADDLLCRDRTTGRLSARRHRPVGPLWSTGRHRRGKARRPALDHHLPDAEVDPDVSLRAVI